MEEVVVVVMRAVVARHVRRGQQLAYGPFCSPSPARLAEGLHEQEVPALAAHDIPPGDVLHLLALRGSLLAVGAG